MLIGNKFNILSLLIITDSDLATQIAVFAQIVDPLIHKSTYFINISEGKARIRLWEFGLLIADKAVIISRRLQLK